ncbi:MAG: hypothetical protein CMP23_14330 [Rickettsiales bacterium]|nr:hypothetical protein [Rickettsiales bacterium]
MSFLRSRVRGLAGALHLAGRSLSGGLPAALLGSVAILPMLFLVGCEGWPLYLHLEPDKPVAHEPVIVDLLEDVTIVDDGVQELAPLPYPSEVRIRGVASSCGFDPSSAQFSWPEHQALGPSGEYMSRVQGWYAGDVDYYALTVEERGWLLVSLAWDNSPADGANAPYLPDRPDEAWSLESDLDFVIFDGESLLLGQVVNDDGFSLAHPEQLDRALAVDASATIVVAVACHHERPSGYTLSLRLASP